MNFTNVCHIAGNCALVSSPRPRGGGHGGYVVIKNVKMQELEFDLISKINVLQLDKSLVKSAKSWQVTISAVNNYMNGDVDNFAKAVLDIITKTGRLWRDDRDVCSLSVSKGRSKIKGKLSPASYAISIACSTESY